MTEQQKEALMRVLEYLWIYGADRHPAPERKLNELRAALDIPLKDYES